MKNVLNNEGNIDVSVNQYSLKEYENLDPQKLQSAFKAMY